VTAAAERTVPAPPCTGWCVTHHEVNGWDEVGRNTTKRCTREIHSAGDEYTRVVVEQFADADDDGTYTYEPTVVVEASGALNPQAARELSTALHYAAGIVDGTVITARQAAATLGVKLADLAHWSNFKGRGPTSYELGDLLLYRADEVRMWKEAHPQATG